MLLPLFWEGLLNASLGATCTIGTSQVVFFFNRTCTKCQVQLCYLSGVYPRPLELVLSDVLGQYPSFLDYMLIHVSACE